MVAGCEAEAQGHKQGLFLHAAACLADGLRELAQRLGVPANGLQVALSLGVQDAPRCLTEGAVRHVVLGHRGLQHALQIVGQNALKLLRGVSQHADAVPEQHSREAHKLPRIVPQDTLAHKLASNLLPCLVIIQQPDVVAVHPAELVLVKDRGDLAHAFHLKALQELVDLVDLLVGAVIPAQLCKVVNHARRQVSPALILPHGDCSVAFRKLAAVWS
mmetsp:Transcript_17401/g.55074  ORF Transcript_17401/g.55074 Transcript_17401/m.55074 type:complete len:217 (+) Transcript_17401:315-965(+)